jgi:hypothetical protein
MKHNVYIKLRRRGLLDPFFPAPDRRLFPPAGAARRD